MRIGKVRIKSHSAAQFQDIVLTPTPTSTAMLLSWYFYLSLFWIYLWKHLVIWYLLRQCQGSFQFPSTAMKLSDWNRIEVRDGVGGTFLFLPCVFRGRFPRRQSRRTVTWAAWCPAWCRWCVTPTAAPRRASRDWCRRSGWCPDTASTAASTITGTTTRRRSEGWVWCCVCVCVCVCVCAVHICVRGQDFTCAVYWYGAFFF